MAQPLIQPSFAAGEIAPSLYARVDLAKYHVGAALLRNFFVDYRGGASNRTGTKFIGDSPDASLPNRLIRFVFSTVQAYVLLFSDFKIKVIMNGAFVIDHTTGVDFVLVTPYRAGDLALLKFTQSADVMTLTHPAYVPMQLTRTAHDVWTLTAIDFTPESDAPTAVTATPSMTGDGTGYRYVVTAIGANGLTESLPSGSATAANSKTMSATTGANQTVSWTGVPGAQLYNIYRTAEIAGGVAPDGQLYGFVGSASGSSFVDANIVPDFSRTPPQAFNPFTGTASGTLSNLSVTPGVGFTALPTLAFSGGGGGSGAAATASLSAVTAIEGILGTGYVVGDVLTAVGGTFTRPAQVRVTDPTTPIGLVVVDGGAYSALPGTVDTDFTRNIVVTGGHGSGMQLVLYWGLGAPTITAPGSNYTQAPAVAVVGGGPHAAGASVTATIVLQVPNCPGCVTYFQQRQVFAGSNLGPQTFWMSKTGDFLNFCYSSPSRADDSIIGTLASQQVNAIKHLVPMASLIGLTGNGAWKIDGGQPGAAITPSTIQAIPQAYNGCSDVPPIIINYDILYVQAKGAIVRDLSYNFYVNIYTGADMTPLANHLFFGHSITEWAYAEEPFKIVWAVRDDGTLLSFTFLKEQDVYAWAHHDTKGKYRSVAVIPEGNEDAVYVIVERYVQGAKHQYIERMASRNMGGIPEGVPNDLSVFTYLGEKTLQRPVPADLSKAWFVDCGLQYPLNYPAASLVPSAIDGTPSIASASIVAGGAGYVNPEIVITDATGSGAVINATMTAGVITGLTVASQGSGYRNPTISVIDAGGNGTGAIVSVQISRDVTVTASPGPFTSADVGSMLRANNGWGVVRVVNSSAEAIVNVQQPFTNTWVAAQGEWSCTQPVTSVGGLHHLEGETVSILADGNVMAPQQVNNATITLEQPASAIFVGLPYTAQLESLYIDTGESPTVQGKRKRIPAVTARIQDSRGFKVGPDFDHLYAPKERTFQRMGEPILPFTGDERVVTNSEWNVQGQVCVQQDNPLPCTVLGLIPEITVGDTP